jgi:hypothetical protein
MLVMENLGKKYFVSVFMVLSSVNFLTGCSMFGPKAGLEDPGFKQKVAPVKQVVPLPVEIAKDIERITEDGLLVYSDNPSYSSAFNIFEKQIAGSPKVDRQVSGVHSAEGCPHHHNGCELTNGSSDGMSTLVLAEGQESTAEIQDCSQLKDQELIDCHYKNQEIILKMKAEKNKSSEGAQAKNAGGTKGEKVLTEDDFVLREEGPLAQSMIRRKTGPLNFRSKMGESDLPELTGGKTVSYIVRLGDTLMKIAFEKYANYLRWKDIYKVNKDKMSSPERMQVGTELTIKNVKYIYIKRDGKPYLIRKMDTLKSISQKLYGTPDRWEEIWKNNPQLIKNPKQIYAGFTLYYPGGDKLEPLQRREPTSAKKPKAKKASAPGPLSESVKSEDLPSELPTMRDEN